MAQGAAEQIADDVKATLAKLYPNDQATGFQEGDLRRWFWVEVPFGESVVVRVTETTIICQS